jgi:hypothetical protein
MRSALLAGVCILVAVAASVYPPGNLLWYTPASIVSGFALRELSLIASALALLELFIADVGVPNRTPRSPLEEETA